MREFGPVFSIPVGMGRRTVVLADVKAAEHFLARDTGVYHQTGFARVFIENLVRPSLESVVVGIVEGMLVWKGDFMGRGR